MISCPAEIIKCGVLYDEELFASATAIYEAMEVREIGEKDGLRYFLCSTGFAATKRMPTPARTRTEATASPR